MNKAKRQYVKMLKKQRRILKNTNLELMNAYIEFKNKKHCDYDRIRQICEKELVFEIKLYITYLGYIDSVIMNLKNELNFDEERFINYQEKNEKYINYINKRKKLKKLIESNTNIFFNFPFLKEIFDEIPMYSNFNLLYEKINLNGYTYDMILELIGAYNAGFRYYGCMTYKDMEDIFKKYLNDIKDYKEENKKKIKTICK